MPVFFAHLKDVQNRAPLGPQTTTFNGSHGLAKLGKLAIPQLERSFDDPDRDIRMAVCVALGQSNLPEANDFLLSRCVGSDVAFVLNWIPPKKDRRFIEVELQAVVSMNWKARDNAAELLRENAQRRDLPRLRRALQTIIETDVSQEFRPGYQLSASDDLCVIFLRFHDRQAVPVCKTLINDINKRTDCDPRILVQLRNVVEMGK
jgi:hypothetical protein